MGPYGPYLQCGEQRTAAIAHASDTAGRKERNSLLPMAPASAETSRNTPPRSEPKEFGNETSGLGVGGVFGENYGNFTVETEVEGPNEPVWYSAISLERAVGLLSLPRVVCEHPRCGGLIKVGFGRFGGYLSYNDSFKALPAGVDVLDVDEGTAVMLADALIEVTTQSRRVMIRSVERGFQCIPVEHRERILSPVTSFRLLMDPGYACDGIHQCRRTMLQCL